MPVSLDIYGGLMAQNNKAISEKAYNFHSATSSIREIAEWFIDYLKLSSITNLKTVESVKKLIDDTMAPNRADCELGFINSYADKNVDKTVNLFLSKDTYELCLDVNPKFHHIKAHTNLDDEHSLGNAIADQLANDALDKFDTVDKGILKYFQ